METKTSIPCLKLENSLRYAGLESGDLGIPEKAHSLSHPIPLKPVSSGLCYPCPASLFTFLGG